MKCWLSGGGSGSSLCDEWQPCGGTQSSSWSQASWPPARHCGCTLQRTLRKHYCEQWRKRQIKQWISHKGLHSLMVMTFNTSLDLHKQQSVKLWSIIRINKFKVTNLRSPTNAYSNYRKNHNHPYPINHSHSCSWFSFQKPLILW